MISKCPPQTTISKTAESRKKVQRFIHSFIRSSIHSFIYSFIRSFVLSFVHSFIHSFVHSFIHSFRDRGHPSTDRPSRFVYGRMAFTLCFHIIREPIIALTAQYRAMARALAAERPAILRPLTNLVCTHPNEPTISAITLHV